MSISEARITTFDERALASLPEAAGFTGPLRKQAFEEFQALPVPSQATEEWRYTDLSEFDLSFTPYTPGGRAENLDGVPADSRAGRGGTFRREFLSAANLANARGLREIARARGGPAASVVAGLVERGLIAEAGREDGVGGAVRYKTTPLFERVFGLESLSQLPRLDDLGESTEEIRTRLESVAERRLA